VLDFLLAALVAVVRVMQKELVLIQHHSKASPQDRLDRGTEVMQQRLDLTPVDIAVQWILENRVQETPVFVAHGSASQSIDALFIE
jgi:hypothetical protein